MKVPTTTQLAQLLGPGFSLSPGGASAATAGTAAVVSPRDAEQVSDVLRLATHQGWAVDVRGSGTKPEWGPALTRCDLVLDTSWLNRLVEHEPGDLVCVVGAGMRLGQLQQMVGGAKGYRQRLMLDPPQGGSSTVGGLIATRAAGPLRNRYGTMRDLLLGAQFVLADGTIARTGGKVVKNVAGYDLDKLLVGSLGTLAVVVEAALRLHPLGEARRAVLFEGADPERAQEFLGRLRRAAVVPIKVEALWPERAIFVQFESSAEGAQRQAELAQGLAAGCQILDPEREAWWETTMAGRPWQRPGVVLGVSVPLEATRNLLGEVEKLAARGVDCELSLRAAIGVGELRMSAEKDTVVEVRGAVEEWGGFVEIHRAPPQLRDLGSVPRDPVARELAAAVKAALDPSATLAPGRLDLGSGNPWAPLAEVSRG